jgi:hypothetical protein
MTTGRINQVAQVRIRYPTPLRVLSNAPFLGAACPFLGFQVPPLGRIPASPFPFGRHTRESFPHPVASGSPRFPRFMPFDRTIHRAVQASPSRDDIIVRYWVLLPVIWDYCVQNAPRADSPKVQLVLS